MMTQHKDNDMLEALFQDARRDPPVVPDALMARILADAEAMQPDAKRTGWRSWFAALGGAPGVGGLITATCVGFWIGLAPPSDTLDVAGQLWGVTQSSETPLDIETLTSFGWDVEEG